MDKYTYKIMRGLRKVIMGIQGYEFSHTLPCCNNPEEANIQIRNLLENNKPCMIARYGATELL